MRYYWLINFDHTISCRIYILKCAVTFFRYLGFNLATVRNLSTDENAITFLSGLKKCLLASLESVFAYSFR